MQDIFYIARSSGGINLFYLLRGFNFLPRILGCPKGY